MKKLVLAVACVAFVASMTSCKKDCTCTTKVEGFTDVKTTTAGVAKKDCEAMSVKTATGSVTCVSE